MLKKIGHGDMLLNNEQSHLWIDDHSSVIAGGADYGKKTSYKLLEHSISSRFPIKFGSKLSL